MPGTAMGFVGSAVGRPGPAGGRQCGGRADADAGPLIRHTCVARASELRWPLHSRCRSSACALAASRRAWQCVSVGLPPHRASVLQGGHYIAYIKCGGGWYQCDDACVMEVDEATARSRDAYMLYYSLRGAAG